MVAVRRNAGAFDKQSRRKDWLDTQNLFADCVGARTSSYFLKVSAVTRINAPSNDVTIRQGNTVKADPNFRSIVFNCARSRRSSAFIVLWKVSSAEPLIRL